LFLTYDFDLAGIRAGNGLSKHMQMWKDDLDERLKGKERPPRYWEHPELEKGSIHKHCAYCINLKCDKTGYDLSDPENDRGCNMMACKFKCGQSFHLCKYFEHQIICSNYEEVDEFAWMYRGVEAANHRQRSSLSKRKKDKEKHALKPPESLFVGPGFPALSMKTKKKTKVKGYFVPAPPPMPESVLRTCRLDIKLETVTRLQTKPKAMYTFVCAQEFRRDEFPWHSKNVHDDIHGGMNNWMEHRCPLASLGCQYSNRRLYPHDASHTVTFSAAVESFGIVEARGVQPYHVYRDGQRKTLLDLPNEILMDILLKMDSFS
jgi:hypothetical protein